MTEFEQYLEDIGAGQAASSVGRACNSIRNAVVAGNTVMLWKALFLAYQDVRKLEQKNKELQIEIDEIITEEKRQELVHRRLLEGSK